MSASPVTTEQLDEMLDNMNDVMVQLKLYADTQIENIQVLKDLNEKAKAFGSPE
jgi:hypothetical protein